MSRFRSSPSGKEAAELLRGTNLTVNPNGRLSPVGRPRRFFEWDYFCSGNNTSGTIGRMGWNLVAAGGSYARQSATLSSPAKGLLSTSNVNNNAIALILGDTTGRAIGNPVEAVNMQWAWQMNNSLASKRIYFGWNNNLGINPNTSNVTAFGVMYDSSISPNYLLINKFGNPQNATFNTGIPVPQNSPQLFSIVKIPNVLNRYDVIVATDEGNGNFTEQYLGRDILLQAPVAGYNAGIGLLMLTIGAVVSTVQIGYWGLTSAQLVTNYISDGAFLEH